MTSTTDCCPCVTIKYFYLGQGGYDFIIVYLLSGLCKNFSFSAPTLLVGQQEGHQTCKKTRCWWQHFEWSFAHLIAPVITTISITLSSNKIQNEDILVPANPGPPGKWPLKRRERTVQNYSTNCHKISVERWHVGY